jgi:hypothetical protein
MKSTKTIGKPRRVESKMIIKPVNLPDVHDFNLRREDEKCQI